MNLNHLKDVDLMQIDHNQLVDIQEVVINQSDSKKQKIESYIKQIKNPYCFKVGKVIVKVSFTEGGGPFQEHLENALKAM